MRCSDPAPRSKFLCLAPSWRSSFSRGYVYNLTTSDVDTLQLFCQQLFSLVSAPLRVAVAMALLWAQLGASSVAALALLCLLMPLQVRSPAPSTDTSSKKC